MDAKDKLIEMIQSATNGCARYWASLIADKLLAEGVIVPPCKVGQTVWHIRRTPEHMGGSYIVKAKVICIPIRVYSDEVYSDLILRYTQRNGMPEEASSKLGKYAFLTREEAEKALAERGEK